MIAYKTTVATPATSHLLADADILRNNLTIPEVGSRSDELDRSLSVASRIIERYCDRTFASQIYYGWYYEPDYLVPVIPITLRHYPVINVIEFEHALISDTSLVFTALPWVSDIHYRLDDSGRLMVTERVEAGILRIEYEAGFATIPTDLAEVALQLARDIFLRRARESTIEQETIPDQASASYFETTELLTMPQKRVLDTYRNLWML